MPRFKFKILWNIAAVLLAPAISAFAQSSGTPSKGTTLSLVLSEKMATAVYAARGNMRELSLWREEIAISTEALLDYFKRNPERYTFPNTAFVLKDSDPANTSDAKVVWITYVYINKLVIPQRILSADIVMHDNSILGYVVLSNSRGWAVDIQVYQIHDRNLGVSPLELDPFDFTRWPAGDEPIASFHQEFHERDISGVGRVVAVLEGSSLLIYAQRENTAMPSVTFRLNLQTKEWAQPIFQSSRAGVEAGESK